jgi:hypothetical protein
MAIAVRVRVLTKAITQYLIKEATILTLLLFCFVVKCLEAFPKEGSLSRTVQFEGIAC